MRSLSNGGGVATATGETSRALRRHSQLNQSDMALIKRIVNDSKRSPSQTALSCRGTAAGAGGRRGSGQSTPRSGDLLHTQAHLFTAERPFVPRTLRTDRTSKLTQFRCYNPPRRRRAPAPAPTPAPPGGETAAAAAAASGSQRAVTPMTGSVDLMNETLRSRDLMHLPTPSGVPPLDISLDADHLLWIKEHANRTSWRDSLNSERTAKRRPA